MSGVTQRNLLILACLAAACGSDAANNAAPTCPMGMSYNPILGECVRVEPDAPNNTTDGDTGTEVDPDLGEGTADADPPDLPDGPDLSCQTDNDGDGAIALECGGDDCDDGDDQRAPSLPERCDEIDNDCDAELNEGLNCAVLAHSDTRLYRVDFFAGTSVDLGPTIPNLYDVDTHPDGTTYGIAGAKLYRFDEATQTWNPAPGELELEENPNGFCIDNDGNAFLTGGNSLRAVDLVQGTTTLIGSMGFVSSSGDCVVNKGNLLFMTSSHTTPDSLIRINGDTAQAMTVGRTGHDQIWGLTAAYNRVFGLTASGDVVEINIATGATTLIAQYPDISFYGAASTPGR